MEWIRVGKLSDFPKGKMKRISIKGKELLVANMDGELYCVDDICTHAECSLADGFLQNDIVTCPCHLAQFNVRTGAIVQNPATDGDIDNEPTFKVKVENNEVFIDI